MESNVSIASSICLLVEPVRAEIVSILNGFHDFFCVCFKQDTFQRDILRGSVWAARVETHSDTPPSVGERAHGKTCVFEAAFEMHLSQCCTSEIQKSPGDHLSEITCRRYSSGRRWTRMSGETAAIMGLRQKNGQS